MVNIKKTSEYLRKKKLDLALVLLAVIMGIFFGWSLISVLVFAFFVWFIINPVPSYLLAFPALFFLIISPFFLIFQKSVIAEETANCAYYFLALSVLMAVYEMQRKSNES